MEDFATLSTEPAASGGGFESIWMALAQSERAEEAEAAHASSHDYHPELATSELIVQIRRLLATERRVGRLVCRYLADLADRIHGQRDRELLAYVDEFHAAACFFDLGPREVRERVRIGRALRQLPRIEAAFIAGELSYSRVREVTRVAQPDTESEWLECARNLDMRALERRVAGTAEELAARQNRSDPFDETSAQSRGAADRPSRASDACGADCKEASAESHHPANGPLETFLATTVRTSSSTQVSTADERQSRAVPREQRSVHTRWLDHDSLSVTFELAAEAWALLERALEGARRKAATPLTDAEALAAVAHDALASQNQAADASDPRCSVVVYECRSCSKSELDTGVGLFELEPAAAATLGCGAREVDLAGEGRGVQRGGPLPAAIRRAVLLRDRCRCRVPGCNRRRYVDVHHLVPRSQGGEHSRRNCITLCSTHHRLLHEGKLLITGDADAEPVFQDAAKRPATFGERDGARVSRRAASASDDEGAATSPRKQHAVDNERASARPQRGGHASDGECALAGSRREWESAEPNHAGDAGATQRGSSNDGAPCRRERHGVDEEWGLAGSRREWESAEPNHAGDAGATQRGSSSDGARWRRERHSMDGECAAAQRRREGHAADGECADPPPRREQQATWCRDEHDAGALHVGMLNENAIRLLQIMGRRGNWNSDILLEKSALPFPELQHALLLLELEGRVRRRGCAFDPV
jgi:hypothetical protein